MTDLLNPPVAPPKPPVRPKRRPEFVGVSPQNALPADPYADLDGLGFETLTNYQAEVAASLRDIGADTEARDSRKRLQQRQIAITNMAAHILAQEGGDDSLFFSRPWPFESFDDVAAETRRLRSLLDELSNPEDPRRIQIRIALGSLRDAVISLRPVTQTNYGPLDNVDETRPVNDYVRAITERPPHKPPSIFEYPEVRSVWEAQTVNFGPIQRV